jgi:hypothetical protein
MDAAVKLIRNELAEAFKRRDTTRADLKRAQVHFQQLQEKIDFQMNETERMNAVLRNREAAIQRLAIAFSKHETDCFDVERLLIDRRDELQLITEQYNRHEEVMRRGEVSLRDREEEHKLLVLQLNDFLRRIEIKQRQIPQLRAYDAEIEELDRQLERERRDVDAITAKLEVPDLKQREAAYCGRDFSLRELEEKVAVYEQRINSKEQQLWEKQILLTEISEKIDELNIATGAGDPRMAKILEKGGGLRSEAMALKRQKMAAMAEAAVYQAQSVGLQEEKNVIREEIEKATVRAGKGEAFDSVAEKRLRMHERDAAQSQRRQRSPDADSDEDEEERRPGRQHFDAYPTADGLSKPYGAFPVFQPAPPSGQLRHYRKETLRPIEL